ncbi:MAG TPA: DUF1080 domain-containing protein [Gemmataceae bacterium]|nr:DUF1080 domain-containing protein [Gemmataceae bacterium]
MRRVLVLAAMFCFPLVALGDDPKVKQVTDPAKAGPDFAIQGEYVGETLNSKTKLGVEVIARGDGKFDVNFLPGGLRGEGGDYEKRIEGKGQLDTRQVGVTIIECKNNSLKAAIMSGKMSGQTDTGDGLSLKRVIRESKTLGAKPPKDAIILFDGTKADEWKNGKIVDGNLLGSDIDSKREFQDHKGHVEFRLSFMPYARDQGRSNSGVYLQHRYEIQVLDSFGLKGENNECGGVYSQFKPLVNMCYPPLQWQTYDFEFQAARFENGKKVKPAVISVWHNGVLIQDKVEPKGPTGGGREENDKPGPLHLQGHGGQVQYRNIWVVETK